MTARVGVRSFCRLHWVAMAATVTTICLVVLWFTIIADHVVAGQNSKSSTTNGDAAPSCTAARPADDALRPFCFIPKSTISTEAQKVLSERRVKPASSLRSKPLSEVLQFQEDYNKITEPISQAAADKYLQGVSNKKLAGVQVYTATPKGFSSSSSSKKLLVYLHGGAYIKGSCGYLWQVTAATAQLAGMRVMCVDYRLAPQHPFPAGLDDALAVYKALIKSGGYTASSIGFIGDSAGGGLTLALMQRLLQEGLPLPGAVGLMAPWADLRKSGDTFTTLTGVDPVLQYDLNLASAALDYAGGDAARLSEPLVSPLLAEYSSSRPFPPTLIQVGLRDSLLSTAVLLYRKMVAGGLKHVVFSPWEGMWHVFQSAVQVPEAVEAAQEMAQFFKQHLA